MTTVGIIITAIATVLGSGGLVSILTARSSSKRNQSQSETEARAQFTNEFNALVAQQNLQIKDLKTSQIEQGEQLNARINQLETKLANAEDYIDTLIIGVSNNTIPPIPPRT